MSLAMQQDLESSYVMRTFGRKPVEFVSGSGMRLYDDAGAEYLDFLSGIGVASLGHCHPAIVSAIADQAAKLVHVGNYFYIERRGEVARALSEMLGEGAGSSEGARWKTFFANSGAEANECAIKLARLAARKRAKAAGIDEARAPRLVVTLDRSFHGRTLATLAATAQPAKQEAFAPLPDGFTSTPANDVRALAELFEQRGGEICAVMVEVVQGESGVHPCTREFLEEIRRLTKSAGALMICDEVQCGMYRCGTYPFAFQHFGIEPDIVTMAKGIASGFPCGACAAREDVADAFSPGDHGSTFGGSCLALAAIDATLSELRKDGFGDHVSDVGAYLQDRLSTIEGVSEVRGLGLMVALDIAEDRDMSAPDVVNRGLACGLVLNATGEKTLRFLPPLVCERSDVDELVGKLAQLI